MIRVSSTKRKILIPLIAIGILLQLFISAVIGLDILHCLYYEKMPPRSSHKTIEDSRLSGHLDLYYNDGSSYYWLYYTDELNKQRLIMWDGDIHGKITVKVSGANEIELLYAFDKSSIDTRKDKTIHLNLNRHDAYKVSLTRRILQEFCDLA